MRKLLALALALSLALSLFAVTSAGAESLGTIKVMYSGENEGTRVELYERAKAEIEAEYPGTKVELEVVAYSELSSKQITACRAGVGAPDVMSQSATATNGFMVEGLLLPLEDLMSELGRDLKAEFNPAFFELMEDAEHIYGVPQSRTALALVYNKTLLAEAGYTEPPKTWAEVQEYAQKLTKTKADGTKQYGFAYPGTAKGNMWFRIIPDIWSAGGDMLSEDGRTCVLDSEATREAVSYYTSFYLNGTAPESTMELDAATICQMMAAGTVAMYVDNIGAVASNLLNTIDVGVSLYPGKDGPATVGMGGWNICIPKAAENPKGAAIFIDKVTNMEAMALQLKFPALAKALEDEKWTTGINAGYSEMLGSHVRDLPPFTNLAGAQDAMMTMIQAVMTGQSDVDTAVKDAAAEIQSLLDEQYAE